MKCNWFCRPEKLNVLAEEHEENFNILKAKEAQKSKQICSKAFFRKIKR
jgi:hypothetical protein